MLTVQNVSHDPFYNQAFEEYVYQTYLGDDISLLWQNSPAVVGSYQNICREVHVEALRQRGIPVVRRISGGGTIYCINKNPPSYEGGFLFMLLSGEGADTRCICVQPVPLAERLQLKGQLGAAHDGVVVVVKAFVVKAGQGAGFLRRDDAELGENREDGVRDNGGGAVLHFKGDADPLILDAHGIERAGA